jgi:hypothetical protein
MQVQLDLQRWDVNFVSHVTHRPKIYFYLFFLQTAHVCFQGCFVSGGYPGIFLELTSQQQQRPKQICSSHEGKRISEETAFL